MEALKFKFLGIILQIPGATILGTRSMKQECIYTYRELNIFIMKNYRQPQRRVKNGV